MWMNSNRSIFRSIYRLALVLALFALGATSEVAAQQPADCGNCACTMPGMQGTAINLTTSATAGACPGSVTIASFNVGRFGRFYTVAGRRYTLSLCGETENTMIYVTTNTTIPGVIACDDDGCGVTNGPSQVSFIATTTGTHRLYVLNGDCPVMYPDNTIMSVTITCNLNVLPANNEPCTAQALPMNSTSCNYASGSNVGATNAAAINPGIGAPPSCAGSLYQGADVWYTTTVPASGLIGIQTSEGSICAGAIQLYTAPTCGGTFTQLPGGCTSVGLTGPTSEPGLVFDAAAAGLATGTTVYIRYWERNGNENGSFDICAYEAIRPPNDNPCGSIAMPLGTACAPVTYSTENASPLTANITAPFGTCAGTPPGNDLWFSFQVPAVVPPTGITVNSIAGTLNNMSMAWYRLTAGTACGTGTMTQIGCNQNQTAANLMPRINSTSGITLNPGETIYVRIWSEQPWVGTFQICAFINQTPPNDNPCGAYPLALNYGCVLTGATNEAATQTPTSGSWNVNNPTCGGAPTTDVWYTVTVPPNGVVQFDTQAGSMTNAAMAVYSSTGSCGANNLNLTQVACATAGSQQGSTGMPYLNVTGQTPGSTLYVRVWREAGTEGTFNICARRTDPPPGDCFYTLNMADSGGDGWGGSFVTVCVGGACSNYTVNGSAASVNIGANIGQPINITYTAAGGFQNQNSYVLTQYGSPVFVASSPPTQGQVYAATVTCDPPPAPPSDCIGATTLCSVVPQVNQFPQNTGGVADLNPANRGCMSANERQGLWYTFSVSVAGTLGFTVTPTAGADYDLAVWGPYPAGSNLGNICPPAQPPSRCTWACCAGPTGLAVNAALPTSEGAGGNGFVRHYNALVGEVYLLYIDNYSMNGVTFNMSWTGTAEVGCIILPVELLDLQATPEGNNVAVEWTTASENDLSHFNVERSADGVHFEDIGQVEAIGDAANANYRFIDDAPLQGLSYYRLMQVGKNGEASNSRTVMVMMTAGGEMEVHPNPADDLLYLSLVLAREKNMKWQILDMSGRLIAEDLFAGVNGRNTETIPVAALEKGSYVLKVTDEHGGTVGNSRFVKR